ncbi:hypothetical protein MTO96_005918 [Rhipicephalus appendiculatus]
MFVGNETSAEKGGLSVGVPGELQGYRTLLRDLNGTLPWRDHFDDAIRLARYGFPVGPDLAKALHEHKDDLSDSLKNVFWNETTNDTLAEGDLLVQADLADTLEAIANKQPDDFTVAGIGKQLVKEVQANGGVMTEDDLKDYEDVWKQPATQLLPDGNTLYTMGRYLAVEPFSQNILNLAIDRAGNLIKRQSGAVLALVVNLVRNITGHSSTWWHRLLETAKYAYNERPRLADTEPENVDEIGAEYDNARVGCGFEKYYQRVVHDR